MRVLGTGVDLEFAHRLTTERAFGDHALNAAADGIFGLACQHLSESLGLNAARIAGVAIQHLAIGLTRGHLDLGCVDHDHVVTSVDMGGEDRLVLATQEACNFGA